MAAKVVMMSGGGGDGSAGVPMDLCGLRLPLASRASARHSPLTSSALSFHSSHRLSYLIVSLRYGSAILRLHQRGGDCDAFALARPWTPTDGFRFSARVAMTSVLGYDAIEAGLSNNAPEMAVRWTPSRCAVGEAARDAESWRACACRHRHRGLSCV